MYYYSAIGVLAMLILLIENQDILLSAKGTLEKPAWRVYRRFLFAVLVYYGTDILWGILESRRLRLLLFADTTVYYAAMAAGVLFWAEYTVAYMEEENASGRMLVTAGRLLAGLISALSVVNIVVPVLFTVDRDCVYRALPARYGSLVAQIMLLLFISGYAFTSVRRGRCAGGKKRKHLAVALFGLIMALFLFIQLWFPFLPLYTIAYFLGTTLLHTFVISDEKEEYRRGMEEARKITELKDTLA